MKSLEVLHLCRKLSAITLSRGFRTNVVLLVRKRGKVLPRIPYEPGVRHRGAVLEDAEIGEEVEFDELEGELDVENVENVYDLNISEMKRKKAIIRHQITARKFFSPAPQPPMLTWNERECIKYLHKQDPVQWDIKTLSEGFPATPDTIKKILRSKHKVTPERAKKIDSVVQKNWGLLAEGKLEAEPHALEHFKKFVNRREVLLEQLKNVEFYLPEVKKEHVWNKGEFTGILSKYERKIEKILKESEEKQKPKMITDSAIQEGKGEGGVEEEKNILDVVHKKIQQTASRPELEKKDSFMFGGVTDFYSKPTTLEDLKKKILSRANKNKKINLLEKALLQDTLNRQGDKLTMNSGNFYKNYDAMNKISHEKPSEFKNDNNWNNNEEGTLKIVTEDFYHTRNEESSGQNHSVEERSDNQRINHENMKEKIKYFDKFFRMQRKERKKQKFPDSNILPDKRTHLTDETNVGKLFCSKLEKPQLEEKLNAEKTTAKRRESEIDFSNPVRLERESKYYDQEVKDIENTEFWNTQRNSKQKASMELQKPPLDGPKDISKGVNFAKTTTLSLDSYPERINIPKSKRGSGLTFKVKDCYYDDDGEFLYRVPGMTN